MGFIAKSVTKRKVAPEAGPDNVVAATPWDRSLQGAARVRAAVLAHSLDTTSSQTRRGQVGVIASERASSFWYERTSDRSWSVALGARSGKQEVMADWSLDVHAAGDGNVVVSTLGYLTIDGALVNPELFDVVRSGLLDSFAYDYVGEALEVDACRASLEIESSRYVRTGAAPSGDVAIRARGTTDLVDAALAQIALPLRRSDPDDFVWQLGPGELHLRRTAVGDTQTLTGELSLDAGDVPTYERALFESTAHTWRVRAPLFLAMVDADHEIDWPGDS